MLAVADTSPLNYLIWIGYADLLPQLYGGVIVPPEVLQELLAPEAPVRVREWAGEPPLWVEVRNAAAGRIADPRWKALDSGEKAVLALAAQLGPCLLLIDERAGAMLARSLGMAVTGTLGVLDEAARRKWISLPKAIGLLQKTSFRYPPAVVARLLEEDQRRQGR